MRIAFGELHLELVLNDCVCLGEIFRGNKTNDGGIMEYFKVLNLLGNLPCSVTLLFQMLMQL